MLLLAKDMEERIIENTGLILNLGILSFGKIRRLEKRIKRFAVLV